MKSKPKTDRRTKAELLAQLAQVQAHLRSAERSYTECARERDEAVRQAQQHESNFIAMQLSNDKLRADNSVLRIETAEMYYTARRLEKYVDQLEAELVQYHTWDLYKAEVRIEPNPNRHW